jgi:O-Antigen ligase
MLGAVRERGSGGAGAPVPALVDTGPTATSGSDRFLFGGLVALVVAATMSGLSTDVTIWGHEFTIRPDQVVLLALLPAIAVALTRRGLARCWSILHLPVFAFLAANAVASVTASGVRAVSLQGTALMTVYVAMYTGVVVLITDRTAWARRLLAVVVGLGFVHALYGTGALLLFAIGIDVGGVMFGQVGPHSVTAKSTFPEANLFAAFMLLLAIFSAVRLVSASGGARRAAWFGGFCLAGLVLVLTVTRAAWLSLLLGLLLLGLALLIRGKSLRRVLAAMRPVLLGLVVIAVLSLVVCDPLLSRLWGEEHVLLTRVYSLSFLVDMPADCANDVAVQGAAGVNSCTSVVGRREMFKEGFEGWRQRPLLGHGTFGGKATGRDYWMSSFIQALYDTGLLGAVALLAMYLVVMVAPWRASRRAFDAGERDLFLACAIGNALLMLTSQLASFLWVGFPWIFMGLTTAAVVAMRARHENATA